MFDSYSDIVTVEQITSMLGIGKSSAYNLVKSNQINHVRVGMKYIIPKQAVIDFVTDPCYNGGRIIGSGQNSVTKEEMTK